MFKKIGTVWILQQVFVHRRDSNQGPQSWERGKDATSQTQRLSSWTVFDNLFPIGHMRSHSRDNFLQSGQGSEGGSSETDGRNQVVAVGTPLATVVGTQQGPVMVRVTAVKCTKKT